MEKILPVLKPSSEYKLQLEREMYIKPLMDFPESPFVMFDKDLGVAVAYTKSSDDFNENIQAEAIKNLKDIDVARLLMKTFLE